MSDRPGSCLPPPTCSSAQASPLVLSLLMRAFPHLSRPFLLHPLPAPPLSSVPTFPNALSAGLCPVLAPGQLADRALPRREGSLKVGDRLLSVDGIPLHGASLAAALATLRQCSHEALFQVEYDVAIPGEPGPAG